MICTLFRILFATIELLSTILAGQDLDVMGGSRMCEMFYLMVTLDVTLIYLRMGLIFEGKHDAILFCSSSPPTSSYRIDTANK